MDSSVLVQWMVEIDATAITALSANLDDVRAKMFAAKDVTAQLSAQTQSLSKSLASPAAIPVPRVPLNPLPTAPAPITPAAVAASAPSPITAAMAATSAPFTSPAGPAVPKSSPVPAPPLSMTAAMATAQPAKSAPVHSMTAGMNKADQGAIDNSFLEAIGKQLQAETMEKMNAVKVAIKGVGEQTKVAGEAAVEMAKKHAAAWQGVATGVKYAGAAILGFVAAGMQGTAENERILFSLQMISREIASIFTPTIHRMIDMLQDVLGWFRQLGGEQQGKIERIAGAFIVVGIAASSIVPRIATITGAVQGLWAVMAANPILAVVGAIGAMLAGTEKGRESLGKMFDAAKPILSAVADIAKVILQAILPIVDAFAAVVAVVADTLAPILQVIGDFLKSHGELIGSITAGVLSMAAAYYVLSAAFGASAAGAAANAMNMALLSTTTVTASAAGLTLTGVLGGVAVAFRTLTAAMMANPIIAIASAIAGAAAFLFSSRRRPETEEAGRQREQLSNAGSGFEGFDQTWKAMQQAANKMDIPQRHLSATEQSNVLLGQIAAAVNRPNIWGRPNVIGV